jgi:mRNA interferase HigB
MVRITIYKFWKPSKVGVMLVLRKNLPAAYFATHPGGKGIGAAKTSYNAWLAISERADWKRPADVTGSHPKASILKAGRAVFNIKGNSFGLVCRIYYGAGTVEIRFFGTHKEYDAIDAEVI